MTPFLGGMLADRLLGQRRAVILGGTLMAAGELLMMVPQTVAFFTALALLIAGNGFFKPNISTIVGSLYGRGNPRRDGGFTIFYMGINLGAAMAPLLCGFIGERYGYHWGFGLAAIGMIIGVAIFVAPTIVTQLLISVGAVAIVVGLLLFHPDNPFSIGLNVFSAICILVSGGVAVMALGRGGLPAEAGAVPDRQRLQRYVAGPLRATWAVYLGTAVAVAFFFFLVSGFAFFAADGKPVTLIPTAWVSNLTAGHNPFLGVVAIFLRESSRPATLVLSLAGLIAFGYLIFEMMHLTRIPRQRMYVVLILTFFSVLFFAFFEQAGSSLTNFTDRNVDRVTTRTTITAAEIGKTIDLQPTQKQLGYHNGSQLFTLNVLTDLRNEQERLREKAFAGGTSQLPPRRGPISRFPGRSPATTWEWRLPRSTTKFPRARSSR